MVQTLIKKSKSITSSEAFTNWVIIPLCIWGVFTILSVNILFLAIVGGFMFFGVCAGLLGTESKFANLILLPLLYAWMVGMYIATFTAMAYLPIYWLSSSGSIAPFIGAGIGFIAGTWTVILLIRTCIKAKKEEEPDLS